MHLGEGERYVELAREGVDCVVCAGLFAGSDMVVRRLGVMQEITGASPAYLAEWPSPLSRSPGRHTMIGFVSSRTDRPLPLEFSVGGATPEVMLPASVLVGGTSAAAARLGLGLVQAPRQRFDTTSPRALWWRFGRFSPAQHPSPSFTQATVSFPRG